MKNIAIVGVSGLVGERLLRIVENKLPNCKLQLYGNASVGTKIAFANKHLTVLPCQKLMQNTPDYALFTANEQIAQIYVPLLAQKGTICIDNSTAFRSKKEVPLVIPCINGKQICNSKIIANPNCTTIQVAIALNALVSLGLQKVTVATYQSASGGGTEGLKDLDEQRGYGKLRCFAHPIWDNVIPFVGKATADGTTDEENKLKRESRKILQLPKLQINSFCARVPVSVGHGAFVSAQISQKTTVNEVRQLLSKQDNLLLFDNPQMDVYPMPSMMRNTKYVGVGRVYMPNSRTVNMFVVADNLLRGAAYNAFEILQYAMEQSDE